MLLQGVDTSSRTTIPELDSVILAATNQHLPIRAESKRAYPVGMPAQDVEAASCAGIPQAYGLVITAAGKHTAWAKSNRSDISFVSLQDVKTPSRAGIP